MQHLNYKKHNNIIIPGNGGIPPWVLHQWIGSQVRLKPPSSWFEDDSFLGFSLFFLYVKENHLALPGDPLDHSTNELWAIFYPKNAIPEKYDRNQPPYFLDTFHSIERFTHPLTPYQEVRSSADIHP